VQKRRLQRLGASGDAVETPRNIEYTRIPALESEGEEIYPEFWLATDVSLFGISALECFKYLPTMGELRYAFEVDKRIRKSILEKWTSEWTCSFLRDGKELIERPDRLVLEGSYSPSHETKQGGRWRIEGGKRTQVKLPQEGWILGYDRKTGLPTRTDPHPTDSQSEAAMKIFGWREASLFSGPLPGLTVLYRDWLALRSAGSFSIVAARFAGYRIYTMGARIRLASKP